MMGARNLCPETHRGQVMALTSGQRGGVSVEGRCEVRGQWQQGTGGQDEPGLLRNRGAAKGWGQQEAPWTWGWPGRLSRGWGRAGVSVATMHTDDSR